MWRINHASLGYKYKRTVQKLRLLTFNLESRRMLGRTTVVGGSRMSTTQAFLLGLMIAWTPSLVLLAWLLSDRSLENR